VNFRQWLEKFIGNYDGSRWNDLRGDFIKTKVPTYKNPSPQELENALQHSMEGYVGGIFMKNGDVYIWPRDYATHFSIAKQLTLGDEYLHFYVYEDGQVNEYDPDLGDWDDWKESPNVKHMLSKIEDMRKTA
jgi:hypothetical protein